MKKIVIILLGTALWVTAYGQRENKDCEKFPGVVDSVYSYRWDQGLNQWTLNTITVNFYAEALLSGSRTIKAGTREPVSEIEYHYNSDNFLDNRLAYHWVNGVKTFLQRSYFATDAEGKNLSETYHNWNNGQWVLWGRFLNEYQDGRLVRYIQQLVNSSGEFVDYADYVLTYAISLLENWSATRLSDGVLLWSRSYFYDESGKLSYRLIYQNRFNPQTNVNELRLATRNSYFYDQYSLNDSTTNEIWTGSAWEFSSSNIYFRRLEATDHVYICFKNKSLCINENSLEGFLKRGAVLGKCKEEEECKNPPCDKDKKSAIESVNKGVKIYPNPATESAQITGIDSSALSILLVNGNGSIVRNLQANQGEDQEIYRNGLPSGRYIVYVCGNNGEVISSTTLIFR